jgi:hypothetical protein
VVVEGLGQVKLVALLTQTFFETVRLGQEKIERCG